jgi:hypothetical protein
MFALRLEALETREVPAALNPTLDLTRSGSTGTVDGTIFTQSSGGGRIDSVVQLHTHGCGTVEQGYNTSARPLPYGEEGNRRATHSELVTDVPAVTIGGARYREFVLDVSEGRPNGRVSLDDFRIYVSDSPALSGRVQADGTLAGATLGYQLGADRWLAVDSGGRRNGIGDVVVDVPEAAFVGGAYVYLYSKFGQHIAANGGAEVWGTRGPGGGPVQLPTAAGISGAVFVNGAAAPDGTILQLVNYETGEEVATATVVGGHYTFSGILGDGTTLYVVNLPPQMVGGVNINAASTLPMTFPADGSPTDLHFGGV